MTQIDKLKQRIPFDSKRFSSQNEYNTKMIQLLDDAKMLCLSLLYPFLDDDTDLEELEIPKKYNNWQIRAAVEIFKWEDNQGIASYAENGLSFTKLQDGVLSVELMNEIIPKVRSTKGTNGSSLGNDTYLIAENNKKIIRG